MSMRLSSAVLDLPIPATAKAVLHILADHADDQNGRCWPSIERICWRTSRKERAVQGALVWLEAEGWFRREDRPGTSSLFWLDVGRIVADAAATLAAREKRAKAKEMPPSRAEALEAPPQDMHPRSKCGGNGGEEGGPPQEMRPTPADAAPHPRRKCGGSGKELSGTSTRDPARETQALFEAESALRGAEADWLQAGSPADFSALDPQHLVQAWNGLAGGLGLQRVDRLTPKRRDALLQRIGEASIDDFVRLFGKVAGSDYLSGRKVGARGCTLDWLSERANFRKVLRGGYD